MAATTGAGTVTCRQPLIRCSTPRSGELIACRIPIPRSPARAYRARSMPTAVPGDRCAGSMKKASTLPETMAAVPPRGSGERVDGRPRRAVDELVAQPAQVGIARIGGTVEVSDPAEALIVER